MISGAGGPGPILPYGISEAPYPASFQDVTGRTAAPATISVGEKTGVFLLTGQSNIGNSLTPAHNPVSTKVDQLDPFSGNMYRCKDPILGANGTQNGTTGSIAGYLGDELINAGVFARVIFIPIAVGGTPFKDWGPAGPLHNKLRVGLLRMRALLNSAPSGATVGSGILLMQGETDNQVLGTTQADATVALRALIATSGGLGLPQVPWWLSKCTYAAGVTSAPIRAAVDAVVNGSSVRAGPDLDTLNSSNRTDNVHFNATGAAAASVLWRQILAAYY